MKNIDPRSLSNSPTYSNDGAVYAIVEAPKGSGVKLKYDESMGAFFTAKNPKFLDGKDQKEQRQS
jgi:inorganic pyrophosphatase